MHIAALYNSEKAAGALLKAKEIDVNVATSFLPPLRLAVSSYNNKVVEVLCKERPDIINAKNKDGEAPLHEAACGRNTNILNVLIKSGADIDAVNEFGDTPLRRAVGHKREEVVNILIENGANVNTIGRGGYAPLHLAVKNNYVRIVNSLLKREDIKINIVGGDGETPLHKAAARGYIEVVDALLKAEGINVNAVYTPYLWTPLHCATRNGHIDIVRALIEKEANPLLKDAYGRTPGDLAANDSIKNLLKEAEEKRLRKQNKGTSNSEKTEPTSAIAKGVVAGGIVAALGTAVAVALFATGAIAVELVPILIAVVAVTVAALAVGGATYVLSKPSVEKVTGNERKV